MPIAVQPCDKSFLTRDVRFSLYDTGDYAGLLDEFSSPLFWRGSLSDW